MSGTLASNHFDQFDPKPNHFDQFDAPTLPVSAVPQSAASTTYSQQGPNATSGPSGSLLTDAGRRVGDAGIAAVSGIASAPNLLAKAIDWAGRNSFGDPGLSTADPLGRGHSLLPDYETVSTGLHNALGATQYVPETQAGRAGSAAMNMAATVATGGGLRGLTSVGAGLLPGVAGRLSGYAAEGLGGAAPLAQVARQTAQQMPSAAASGAGGFLAQQVAPDALKPVAGLAGALVGGGLAQTPNAFLPRAGGSMAMEDAQLAKQAMDRDIPLGLAQVTNSFPIKTAAMMAGKVPFSGGSALSDEQLPAFTAAAIKAMGGDQTRLTQPTLLANAQRIGGVFDDAANVTTIPFTPMRQSLERIATNARLTMPAGSIAPVDAMIQNITDTATANDGNLGGRAYLGLTARGGPLDNMIGSGDRSIANVGRQLRDTLDDHLQINAPPGVADALQTARQQYHVLKTLEPLTLRADVIGGATPSTGIISPQGMRAAVNASYGTVGSARYGGELDTLARIGQRFLKEPSSSGTAENAAVGHGLGALGGLAASAYGLTEAGVPHEYAVGGLMGSIPTAIVANKLLQSQTLANRAVQGSLNPNGFKLSPSGMLPRMPLSMAPLVGVAQQP